MRWYQGLEAVVKENKPLAMHSWYRLGGSARYFCRPTSISQVQGIVQRTRKHNITLKVLGAGANVLIRDHGFEGIVLQLDQRAFGQIGINGTTVSAGAAADLPDLIRRCVNAGLGGLEVLAGIPGSIGGSIRMNAGGKFGQIGDCVQHVQVIDSDGNLRTKSPQEVNFQYRQTDLNDCIIIGARFALSAQDTDALRSRYREIWDYKKRTQPFTRNNAGCIFKNPRDHKAGLLIDRAGLKGVGCGGARISTQHANFIEAAPDSTTADILNLAERVRTAVREKFNIELEYEIDIW